MQQRPSPGEIVFRCVIALIPILAVHGAALQLWYGKEAISDQDTLLSFYSQASASDWKGYHIAAMILAIVVMTARRYLLKAADYIRTGELFPPNPTEAKSKDNA